MSVGALIAIENYYKDNPTVDRRCQHLKKSMSESYHRGNALLISATDDNVEPPQLATKLDDNDPVEIDQEKVALIQLLIKNLEGKKLSCKSTYNLAVTDAENDLNAENTLFYDHNAKLRASDQDWKIKSQGVQGVTGADRFKTYFTVNLAHVYDVLEHNRGMNYSIGKATGNRGAPALDEDVSLQNLIVYLNALPTRQDRAWPNDYCGDILKPVLITQITNGIALGKTRKGFRKDRHRSKAKITNFGVKITDLKNEFDDDNIRLDNEILKAKKDLAFYQYDTSSWNNFKNQKQPSKSKKGVSFSTGP